MFVLDTNVLSELMEPRGGSRVLTWIDSIARRDLFTTTLTEAEIFYGVGIMSDGERRAKLTERAEMMFAEEFAGRVLPFDDRAARHFASIAAKWKKRGLQLHSFDPQMAAIARAQGMTVATRNVKHFDLCGVPIVNPWAF